MATYECKIKANTWKFFSSGNLSGADAAIQIGTQVQGVDIGWQSSSGDSILQLSDGRFTKAKWFKEMTGIPPVPEPTPDPIPDPIPVPPPPAAGDFEITLAPGSRIVRRDAAGKIVEDVVV